MSFVRGFNSGYQMVENTEQRKIENERRDTMMDRNEKRYQDNLATNNTRYEQGVTRQNKMDNIALQQASNQQQVHEIQYGTNGEDGVTQENNKRQRLLRKREDSDHNIKVRKQNYTDVMTTLSNAYQRDPSGTSFSQEEYLQLETKAKGTNAEVMFDQNKQSAGKYLVDKMQNGFADTDPNEIKRATNTYLSSQISRHIEEGIEDKNGVPILGMEFSKWESDGNGGLVAFVNVTNNQGETYEAPVSKFRSSETDDPIRIYNADKLFQHMLAENQLVNILDQNGFLKTMNNPNNKLSTNKTPSEIQENKYVAEIKGITEAQAYDLRNINRSDPSKARLKAYEFVSKRFETITGEPAWVLNTENGLEVVAQSTEGAKQITQQDLEDEAAKVMQFVNGPTKPTNQQAQPQVINQQSDVIAQAKLALSKGADQRKIIQRLIDNGWSKQQIQEALQ